MVQEQLVARGIESRAVLDAMGRVPRHRFVPGTSLAEAYGDHPLPIGHGQTISQPYVVALMTELLGVQSGARVLEIGSGSGYQTAVLAELGCDVWSVEIIEPLAERAERVLSDLGYGRVHVRHHDGHDGWPEHAPFDGIIVTAAPQTVPKQLIKQLRLGGRLVVPVGGDNQDLMVARRTEDGFAEQRIVGVRFVPMTGQAQTQPD